MTGAGIYHAKAGFEEHYLVLRNKEGRLYSDAEVMKLPTISSTHPHFNEWETRKESSQRLCRYLQGKSSFLKILEVGCGNGWLAHRLAGIPDCSVTAIDINFVELQQASRVFSHLPNLAFHFGSIDAEEIRYAQFDAVVFASSIQYFESLADVLEIARQKLKPGGEVHILDTPFYQQSELEQARKRTKDYYSSMGLAEMTPHYFHHTWQSLYHTPHTILYKPSLLNRLLKNYRNPFPWIRIMKKGLTA